MMALDMGQMEGDIAKGSSSIMAVVERTSGRSSSALMSGGSRSPAQGELLL